MATYTPNLNLKKPDQQDFYTVDDFNDNMDKIDDAVGEGFDTTNPVFYETVGLSRTGGSQRSYLKQGDNEELTVISESEIVFTNTPKDSPPIKAASVYANKLLDGNGNQILSSASFIGYVTTAASTAAKVATITGFTGVYAGLRILCFFNTGNSATSPTLNVNATGAKTIYNLRTDAGGVPTLAALEWSETNQRWTVLTQQMVDVNGTPLYYGTCTTASSTVAKTVTVSGFVLRAGVMVTIQFTNGNTAANPTLNVNNTGAKSFGLPNGNVIQPNNIPVTWKALCVYNGTIWTLLNPYTPPITRRTATVTIGSTGAGYTADDVDYLCDGSNDSDMFDNAVSALEDYGGEIKVLEGQYGLNKQWKIAKPNVTIEGVGKAVTLSFSSMHYPMDFTGADNITVKNFAVHAEGDGLEALLISSGTIDSLWMDLLCDRSLYTNAIGINASGKAVIKNCSIKMTPEYDGITAYAIRGSSNGFISCRDNTIEMVGSGDNVFTTGYGIWLNMPGSGDVAVNTLNIDAYNVCGIYMHLGESMTIEKNDLTTRGITYCYGIRLWECMTSIITGNKFSLFRQNGSPFGACFYFEGANNTYIRATNNNCRGWTGQSAALLTITGTTAATAMGTAIAAVTMTASIYGAGNVMGFNTV
jgi:hypothetical protein